VWLRAATPATGGPPRALSEEEAAPRSRTQGCQRNHAPAHTARTPTATDTEAKAQVSQGNIGTLGNNLKITWMAGNAFAELKIAMSFVRLRFYLSLRKQDNKNHCHSISDQLILIFLRN
jgi:hypothetical protein